MGDMELTNPVSLTILSFAVLTAFVLMLMILSVVIAQLMYSLFE
jgi:hypothetical protein